MKPILVLKTSNYSNDGTPKISVSRKGTFFVNRHAVEKLGIKERAKLQLFKDE